ncbi:hypothetical protein LAZ67_11003633 [Cordylochernes scorpioides]|uniref:Uncharacterized protein n=1 Tax=Cordylochernes scorpioides TaxID=51811 RepID=A0ABY6L2R1_9ARAC|nr:hypothetical protein LAZ67_11003633 [Cordylochernes scorpioides]
MGDQRRAHHADSEPDGGASVPLGGRHWLPAVGSRKLWSTAGPHPGGQVHRGRHPQPRSGGLEVKPPDLQLQRGDSPGLWRTGGQVGCSGGLGFFLHRFAYPSIFYIDLNTHQFST